MDSVSQLVTSSKLVTRNELTSSEIRLRALGIAHDLVNTTPPDDMTAWYCKAYKLLGEAKYSAIASMARQPDVIHKKRIFGWLLREEMKND